ncbi:MAG: preprotein translocase subunit SecE [Lachnospiraceae bacterium]|nr:preprotein translocase subunit SecE [Lachnospiraceae bacterium]MDN4742123.1 preprotein translocase subunit SecE [Lachnospiraceae bacterium C1.1]
MADSENTAVSASKKESAKASNSSKPSFFDGVRVEFKKIIWPDKPTLIKQTTAVVIVSVIVGALIAVIDRAVLYGVDMLVK